MCIVGAVYIRHQLKTVWRHLDKSIWFCNMVETCDSSKNRCTERTGLGYFDETFYCPDSIETHVNQSTIVKGRIKEIDVGENETTGLSLSLCTWSILVSRLQTWKRRKEKRAITNIRGRGDVVKWCAIERRRELAFPFIPHRPSLFHDSI